MEKKGRAPIVHELAATVDAQTGFFGDEFRSIRIVAVQGAGNFRVYTHRVAAVTRAIIGDDVTHISQDSGRLHWRRRLRRAEQKRRGWGLGRPVGEWRRRSGGRGA